MSRVILHLGLAKTGTSWLQRQVFPQLDVDFVHCGHYELLNKTPKKNKPLVLSFEGLSGTMECNDRYVNAWRLHKLFPHAKILLVLRCLDDYVNSLYSQYVKGGGIMERYEFDEWVYHHQYFIDWCLYVNYLKRLWGKKVWVVHFEDMMSDKKKFIVDLCGFIDIMVPDDIDYSPMNIKLSQRQIVIWRQWNKLFRSKWNKDGMFPRWLNPCFIYWRLSL